MSSTWAGLTQVGLLLLALALVLDVLGEPRVNVLQLNLTAQAAKH